MIDDPQEIELAFKILNGDSLRNHRIFQRVQRQEQNLISTYFDTPSHTLSQNGWSVRLRRDANCITQTIKGPRASASRPEFEVKVDGDPKHLQEQHLKATPVCSFVGNLSDLQPVFETDIARTVMLLHTRTATIEAALDVGGVYNLGGGADKTKRLAINDLELEKKSGDTGTLFRVAIELACETDIMIQDASKAQRGYQLITDQTPHGYKPVDIDLEQNISTANGIQRILVNIITHLRQNLEAAALGLPDGIHQTRVAFRRLRAALNLFQNVLRAESIDAFDQELRHFGAVFGEARDLDVFITNTLVKAAAELPDANWIDLIRHCAIRKRNKHHRQIVTLIESRRFNSLIISLMGWAEKQPAMSQTATTLFAAVPSLMSTVDDKVATRSRKLTDEKSMHAMRKSIKNLRYAAEFISALYPAKDVKTFLAPCKKMQEVFGEINDLATTRRLIAMLVDDCPAIVPAIEDLCDWLDTRKVEDTSVTTLVRWLQREKPFW